MALAPQDGTVSARRAGHTAAACPPCQGGHRFSDSPHVPAIAEHAGNHHRGGCQFRSRHGPPGRVGNKPAGSTVEYKDERTGSARSRWRRPRACPGPGGGIFRRRRRPPRAIRPAVLRAGSAATWFGLGEVAVECEAPQRGSSRGSDARGGFRARPGSQCALVERALHRRSMIAFAGCLDRRP